MLGVYGSDTLSFGNIAKNTHALLDFVWILGNCKPSGRSVEKLGILAALRVLDFRSHRLGQLDPRAIANGQIEDVGAVRRDDAVQLAFESGSQILALRSWQVGNVNRGERNRGLILPVEVMNALRLEDGMAGLLARGFLYGDKVVALIPAIEDGAEARALLGSAGERGDELAEKCRVIDRRGRGRWADAWRGACCRDAGSWRVDSYCALWHSVTPIRLG